MHTQQFLTKLKFFFAFLALQTTLTAQSEQDNSLRSYRLYNWAWGDGLGSASPTRTCINLPDFVACQNRLSNTFEQYMRGQTVIRGGELKNFVRQFDKLDSISSDEICILGFAFCDSTYLTYRVFVYDLKDGALKHEFEYCVQPNTDVNALLEKLAVKLSRACKKQDSPLDEKEDIDKIAVPSLARLKEALFVHRYEQLYSQTSTTYNVGNRYPDAQYRGSAWSLNAKVKLRAQKIIGAIQHYKTIGRGNYKYLYEQYAARNKSDPVLIKLEVDYPRIWVMLELIVAMEEYKDKPIDEDGSSSNKNHLQATRKSLSRIDTVLQKVKQKYQVNEQEVMTKAKFEFGVLREEMLMATQLLLNCHDIFTTAETHYNKSEYGQATQIYMNVLSNREIEELGKLTGNEMKCGKLKKLSYDKLSLIAGMKARAYKSKLAIADKTFWDIGTNRAHLEVIDALYTQADSLDFGLSLYPKMRRVAYLQRLADSIERKNPKNQVEILKIYEGIVAIHPDKSYKQKIEKVDKIDKKTEQQAEREMPVYDKRTWYNKLIAIAGIVTKHFNAASPNMTMVGQKMTQNIAPDGSKMITLSLLADPKNLKGWVSEINFELGFFESPNEKYVDGHLADALREIESIFGHDLNKIYIKFIGSADATSFKGSALPVGNYKNLEADVALCDGSQQTYPFQSLRKGQLGEQYGGIQTANLPVKTKNRKNKISPEQMAWEDKAKNTALAYLRAKNRLDHLMSKLNENCAKYIQPSLCAQVAAQEGLEHRFVNIEMSFLLKK